MHAESRRLYCTDFRRPCRCHRPSAAREEWRQWASKSVCVPITEQWKISIVRGAHANQPHVPNPDLRWVQRSTTSPANRIKYLSNCIAVRPCVDLLRPKCDMAAGGGFRSATVLELPAAGGVPGKTPSVWRAGAMHRSRTECQDAPRGLEANYGIVTRRGPESS